MRAALLMVAITAGLSPYGTVGQLGPVQLSSGERVRVRFVCNYSGRLATLADPGACQVRLEGWLERVRSDTIFIRTGEVGPERIPVGDIVRLEVSRGKESHTKEGLLIGSISGFLMGALYGVMAYKPCVPSGTGMLSGLECLMSPESAGQAALWGGMAGGLVGGGLGALIGMVVRTDKWVPATQLRQGLNLIAVPNCVGIGASLSF